MTTCCITKDQLNNFFPINDWKTEEDGKKWLRKWLPNESDEAEYDGKPKYLIDSSTGRSYLNESRNFVRFKCFGLALATPFVHAVAAVCNIAYRALILISFYPFWKDTKQSLGSRMTDAGKELLRGALTPIAYVGLELAAIYGILNPYDGRKIYSTLERETYQGHFTFAKCFKSKTAEERAELLANKEAPTSLAVRRKKRFITELKYLHLSSK
jgi:hypothetical protein